MARKRASMREGPLAELFRATEAAQRTQGEAVESSPPADAAPPEPTAATPAQLPQEIELVAALGEPNIVARPVVAVECQIGGGHVADVAGKPVDQMHEAEQQSSVYAAP